MQYNICSMKLISCPLLNSLNQSIIYFFGLKSGSQTFKYLFFGTQNETVCAGYSFTCICKKMSYMSCIIQKVVHTTLYIFQAKGDWLLPHVYCPMAFFNSIDMDKEKHLANRQRNGLPNALKKTI